VQAEIERRGIATASVTMLPEVTGRVRPPRALAVPWPLGYPLGAPNDRDLQRKVLLEAFIRSPRAEPDDSAPRER
jgi:D-proline reductase (dithiol) PrdB